MIKTSLNLILLLLLSCVSPEENKCASVDIINNIIQKDYFENKVYCKNDSLVIELYAPVLEIAHRDRSMIINHKILYDIREHIDGAEIIVFYNRENLQNRIVTRFSFLREVYEDIIKMPVREPEYIKVRDYLYGNLNAKEMDSYDQVITASLDGIRHIEGSNKLLGLTYGYITEQTGRLSGKEYERVIRFFILATKKLNIDFDIQHIEYILEYGQKIGKEKKQKENNTKYTELDSLPFLKEYIKQLQEKEIDNKNE